MSSVIWKPAFWMIYENKGADQLGSNWVADLRLPFSIYQVLLDFSLTVKAATLIFISGCGSAISSAKEGKSGLIYNLVKSE